MPTKKKTAAKRPPAKKKKPAKRQLKNPLRELLTSIFGKPIPLSEVTQSPPLLRDANHICPFANPHTAARDLETCLNAIIHWHTAHTDNTVSKCTGVATGTAIYVTDDISIINRIDAALGEDLPPSLGGPFKKPTVQ